MPTIIFYATVGSEILCFFRTTSSKEKFQKLISTFLTRMRRQGCQNMQLKHLMTKMLGRHFETFTRFADTAKSFIQMF